MKYLKLFEAFNSEKLSKVLSYINKEDRSEFINHLIRVCDEIDFPISELNDSFFQYAPYKKALYTKFENSDNETVKIVKFWFSKSGEYLTASYDDGYRLDDLTFSSNLQYYELLDTIEFSDLKDGDMIYVKYKDETVPLIGKVLKDENGDIYVINNSYYYNGAEPKRGGWRKIGQYSWHISNDVCDSIKIVKELENPWLYNKKMRSLPNHYGYDDKIKNMANFALILNLEKLRKSEFKNLSVTRHTRSKSKEGATAFMKNDEIVRINIERYLSKIAEKYDLSDITNIDKIITRVFGNHNTTLFMLFAYDSTIDFLDDLSRFFYHLILCKKRNNEEDFDYRINKIKDSIKLQYRRSYNNSNGILKKLSEIEKKCKSDIDYSTELKIIQGLKKLSVEINKKLLSRKFECVEDIDITVENIKTIKNLISKYAGNCRTLLNSFDGSSPSYYLMSDYRIQDNKHELIDDIDRCISSINRI